MENKSAQTNLSDLAELACDKIANEITPENLETENQTEKESFSENEENETELEEDNEKNEIDKNCENENLKQEQTKQQNSAFARERREKEKIKLLENTKLDTVIEIFDGINPLTNEPMTTHNQAKEFLSQRLNDKTGLEKLKLNMLNSDEIKSQNLLQKKENDKREFLLSHSEAEYLELVSDKNFQNYIKQNENQKLIEKYNNFKLLKNELIKQVKTSITQSLANKLSSPGALRTNTLAEPDIFSKEQVESMSDFEIKQNFEKIKNSMRFWK